MATQRIVIDNIFGGHATSFHFSEKGQYLTSIAVDPDVPTTDTATDIKTAGILRPVGYSEFSGATMDQIPLWISAYPKGTSILVYASGGDIYTYDSSFGSEALGRAVSTSTGNGFAYYNNYFYYARNTDVGRVGPLDDVSSAYDDDAWTSAVLGTQTALTDTTYPTTRHSVEYPNHVMHAHVDNKLYFADVVDGQGVLHSIRTKKITFEGDTDNGSAFNVLDLPFGYLPFAIESYGNLLVIAASQTTDTTINQGKSALFFWDTVSDSFTRVVQLPDPICSALKYQNGQLYGLSGNLSSGHRLFIYVGGDSIQTLKYMEEGHPPLAGAVDAIGNRVSWGTFTTFPSNSASVLSYGSKSDLFPRGMHNTARSSLAATSSTGLVTALKNVQQANSAFPKFVIGATKGTASAANCALDKQGTTYDTNGHYWRSEVFNINKTFGVKNIVLRFGQAIAANMTLTPTLYFDDGTVSQAGTVINSTNYAGSNKFVVLTSDNFSGTVEGKNNFYLELKWTGTALLSVLLPITIDIEVDENQLV